jgi:glycosyltransferase involved in cell wall biosynthesis
MRILFIAPRFHTNQVSLLKKLQEEGHEIDFFVMGTGNTEDYSTIRPKKIPISIITKSYIRCFKKDIDIAEFSAIAIPDVTKYFRMINQFKPDVIIVRGALSMVYSWFLIPYFFTRIKLIYYTQAPKFVQNLSFLRKVHDYIISVGHKIRWFTPVLYKEPVKEKLKDLTYMDYLPFFIYPEKIEIPGKMKGDKLKFLCVVKFESRKNVELLIDATAQLDKKYKKFELTIIGSTGNAQREAYYETMLAKIKAKDLGHAISLLKNIPHSQMADYYKSHDVFLMPSINEPASVSQLEAMSYGLAIICSQDNGTAHYIRNNKNGYLIEATESNIEAAMERYLEEPKLINIHRQESLNLIKTDYSIDKAYNKLMEIVN